MQQYLERIQKRAIKLMHIFIFMALIHLVVLLLLPVWFDTVEGLANALPFFCKML